MRIVVKLLGGLCVYLFTCQLVACSNVSANQAYLKQAQTIPSMKTSRIQSTTIQYKVPAIPPHANTQQPSLKPPHSHF